MECFASIVDVPTVGCYISVGNTIAVLRDSDDLLQRVTQTGDASVVGMVAVSPSRLAVTLSNKTVKFFNVDTANGSLAEDGVTAPLPKKLMATVATPDGHVLTSDAVGDVHLVKDVKDEAHGVPLGHMVSVTAIAAHTKGGKTYMASADKDGKVRVCWYPNTYEILSFGLRNKATVSAMLFHQCPDGQVVVVAGDTDGAITIQDAESGKLLAETMFPSLGVAHLQMLPDGNVLAVLDGASDMKVLALPSLELSRTVAIGKGVAAVHVGTASAVCVATSAPYVMKAAIGALEFAEVAGAGTVLDIENKDIVLSTLPHAARECKRRREAPGGARDDDE